MQRPPGCRRSGVLDARQRPGEIDTLLAIAATLAGAEVYAALRARGYRPATPVGLAGIAGLLYSAARNAVDRGVMPPGPAGRPVSAEEARQLIRASADDIDFSTPKPPNGPPNNFVTNLPASQRFVTTAGWDQIHGWGRINADAARRSAGPAWVQRLRGATDWRAQLVTRKRSADVVIESSLQGLAVDLPTPLVKTAAESLPVRFERRLLGEKEDRISFSAGGIVSMILLRRIDGENAKFARGTIRFGGAAAEPARNGLWVTGAAKALDLDRWLAAFQQADGGAPLEAGGVDLRLGTVDILGRRFNELAVSAYVQRGQWRVALKGRELDGAVTWLPQGAGRLAARMSTLAIPAASPTTAEPAGDDAQARKEQRRLPELDIVAEQFINKGRPLGRLEVAAVPEENAWRIDRLRLSNPESTFTVDGSWQFGVARPRTHVNVHVEASDIGALLARFGYPEGVKGGTAKLEGSLAWTGAPYEFDVPSLTGNFAMEAAKGQFVKLDPGIGKLLGVMSLQSLPRRMSLDFKDVFSEGFAFDEIAGTVQFNRGTATTDNLRIRGPAAHILMRGDVDLGQETQNLRVRITPHVIETVSLAGALVGGPIAGVAAYLAQQVLRDPFGKLVTYEYGVTGSWSDPVVKRLTQPLAVPEAEGKFE